jgi:Flp pilus assembly protein TadD
VDISTMCRALEYLTLKALPGTKPPGPGLAAAPPDPRIAAIPPDAERQFEAGQEALASNDLASATKHFQKAAELYPRYAEAYQLLGVTQLQGAQKVEDLKAAEASEMKAIDIEKNLPNAYYILGLSRAMMGNTPAAEEPFNTFIAKDPMNPDGHFEFAKTEFALNKFAEAERHARKAIELKEKNPGVEALLAYSLLRQKKATEAREAFKQYLKLDPNSPMKADVEKTIAMIDEHEKQAK